MFFTRSFPLMMRPAYWWDTRAALFWGMYYGFVLSYFPVVAVRLDLSPLAIGLVAAAPYLGYLGTSWFAAHPLAPRCVPACIRGWTLARTLPALMFFAPGHPWFFLTVCLGVWLLEAWAMPAYSVIVQRVYPESYRGRAMGNVRTFSTTSIMLSAALGGVLLDRLGADSYRFLFPAGALAGIIATHYFSHIRVPHGGGRLRPMPLLRSWRFIRRRPPLVQFTVAQMVAGTGNLLVLPLFPIFQVRELHLSNAAIGLLVALMGLGNALTFCFWGREIDRLGPRRTLQRIMLTVPFAGLLYCIAGGIWPVIIATVITGVTQFSWDLAWQNYLYRSTGRHIQGVIGLQYTLLGLRGLIVPVLGVLLAERIGMQPVFLLGSLLIVLGALYLRLPEKPSNDTLIAPVV